MTCAPFGSWASSISVDMMTSASIGLSACTVGGDRIYWLESRASEQGRTSLWVADPSGERRELTPEHYLRSAVHEYGGGSYAVSDGLVVFTHFPTHVVHVIRPGQAPVPITEAGPRRYAGFVLVPEHDAVLAVCEDHDVPGEPVNSIVALDLDGGSPTTLVRGADFYDGIRLGPDNLVAWCEWDHPNMPWDTTRICVGRWNGDTIQDVRRVCALPQTAAMSPAWSPDGRLIYLADDSGYWNLRAWDTATAASTPLHRDDHDYGGPGWMLDSRNFAVLDESAILCARYVEGVQQLGILRDGSFTRIDTPAVTVGSLSVDGDRAAMILGYPDRPTTLETMSLSDGAFTELRRTTEIEFDQNRVSIAEPVRFGEPEAYAWFYPPVNPDFTAPEGELPPLRVLSHGGPTSFSPPRLRLDVQYWTSRGYAVVDVNYGGSTGYGRAYRERLKGRWGIVDVADCVSAAGHLVERGLADPKRMVIEGGSAGGYTTLQALTTTDAFTAGISYFGVADLEALAPDTHKFESRYLDGLVGPYPAAVELYRQRSPIHHLDRLSCPMLILQGTEDKIVPPNQAEEMAEAVRAKGLPLALIMYAGEGHGFRRAETIASTLAASQSFLGQVWGFTPAEELERLAIENLDRTDV